MKTDIHPTYHRSVTVKCACGNTFVTGSTTDAIQVEICSACHPFFTGTAKLLDTAGRVDKFKAKLEQAKALQSNKPVKKAPVTNGELVNVAAPDVQETDVTAPGETQEEEQTHEE